MFFLLTVTLLNIGLTTDQYSTPPSPNRVDYPLIVNNALHCNPRQDPRFLCHATHKLNSNTQLSDECRRREFHRLDTTNLQIEVKFEINVKFHNLRLHPIPSHTTVNFISLPHLFIAINFCRFVSDLPIFRLLRDSITFFKHTHILKIYCSILMFRLIKSHPKHYFCFFRFLFK